MFESDNFSGSENSLYLKVVQETNDKDDSNGQKAESNVFKTDHFL